MRFLGIRVALTLLGAITAQSLPSAAQTPGIPECTNGTPAERIQCLSIVVGELRIRMKAVRQELDIRLSQFEIFARKELKDLRKDLDKANAIRVEKACWFYDNYAASAGAVKLYVPKEWTAKQCTDHMVLLGKWSVEFVCARFGGPILQPAPDLPSSTIPYFEKGPHPSLREVPHQPANELPQGDKNFCGW